ncbi:transcription factor WRKY45-2-like [Lolium rigidum]|uniref:transcription factor WRKY45-2-like n=1 Tax=Lolium rigidum TaxID=89674 RepID=UPI001F5C858A|nr:transcription factor WRKY45-2-like [Lolium rigidum]
MAMSTPATVVLEMMTMGQQSAAQLRELLRAASPPTEAERGQALTAEILRCCDRVIAAMSGVAAGRKRKAITEHGDMPSKRRARGAAAGREVRCGTTADGFVWRKYGQKDINGSKNPRFYYRCAYSAEGCGATRRVQQSQEGPVAFVIAYYGEHTCGGGAGGDPCQQEARATMPPAVVDSGSNAGGVVGVVDWYQNVEESPRPLLDAEQSWRHHGGETSRGRWSSSSSSSSEAEIGTSPVQEFLEGSLGVGWECVVNYLGFSSDLPQTAILQ